MNNLIWKSCFYMLFYCYFDRAYFKNIPHLLSNFVRQSTLKFDLTVAFNAQMRRVLEIQKFLLPIFWSGSIVICWTCCIWFGKNFFETHPNHVWSSITFRIFCAITCAITCLKYRVFFWIYKVWHEFWLPSIIFLLFWKYFCLGTKCSFLLQKFLSE